MKDEPAVLVQDQHIDLCGASQGLAHFQDRVVSRQVHQVFDGGLLVVIELVEQLCGVLVDSSRSAVPHP